MAFCLLKVVIRISIKKNSTICSVPIKKPENRQKTTNNAI
jgi:hypothetical protein